MGSFVGHAGPKENEKSVYFHEKLKPRASENVKDKNYYSHRIHVKAYKKWVATDKHCTCTRHFSPLVNAGAETYVPMCERDKSWWALVKAREGIKLSDEELVLIGYQ